MVKRAMEDVKLTEKQARILVPLLVIARSDKSKVFFDRLIASSPELAAMKGDLESGWDSALLALLEQLGDGLTVWGELETKSPRLASRLRGLLALRSL